MLRARVSVSPEEGTNPGSIPHADPGAMTTTTNPKTTPAVTRLAALDMADRFFDAVHVPSLVQADRQVRSIHWSPYVRVGEVNADP